MPSGRIVTPSGSSPTFTAAITLPDCDVDDAEGFGVLVGDVQPRAVGADRELLGIGAGVDDPLQLVGVGVDFADAVGVAVGRRQRLRIDAGPAGGDPLSAT